MRINPAFTLAALLFTLAGVPGRAAPAPDALPPEVAIPELLKEIDGKLGPARAGCETPATPADPDLIFRRDDGIWSAEVRDHVCKPAFTVAAFCTAVTDRCGKSYYSPTCRASLGSQRTARSAKLELRRRIFRRTDEIFRSLVTEPMIYACCGMRKSCHDALAATRLRVIPGEPDSESEAHFTRESWKISIAESRLLNSFNEESVESVLQHELGHACQYALHEGVPPGDDFPLSSCLSSDTTRKDLELLNGPNRPVSGCIWRALEAGAKRWKEDHGSRPCLGQWMKEAFADSWLAARKTDLSHWAWNCMTRTDDDHGPSQPVMECLLQRPELAPAFCARP